MLEECGTVWNFRLEKPLDVINRTCWTILVGARKARMLRKMWTVGVWLMMFQKGTRTIPGTHPEVTHVTFWQRLAASLLNSKVMASPVDTGWHLGYVIIQVYSKPEQKAKLKND